MPGWVGDLVRDGRRTLNEAEVKRLLADAGVPVVREASTRIVFAVPSMIPDTRYVWNPATVTDTAYCPGGRYGTV